FPKGHYVRKSIKNFSIWCSKLQIYNLPFDKPYCAFRTEIFLFGITSDISVVSKLATIAKLITLA
ncbi:hypothetical protein DP200_25225, partial [Enterobacter hormaechei subsp. oharae]